MLDDFGSHISNNFQNIPKSPLLKHSFSSETYMGTQTIQISEDNFETSHETPQLSILTVNGRSDRSFSWQRKTALFSGSRAGKKDDKITRCFLDVILGTFWCFFWSWQLEQLGYFGKRTLRIHSHTHVYIYSTPRPKTHPFAIFIGIWGICLSNFCLLQNVFKKRIMCSLFFSFI